MVGYLARFQANLRRPDGQIGEKLVSIENGTEGLNARILEKTPAVGAEALGRVAEATACGQAGGRGAWRSLMARVRMRSDLIAWPPPIKRDACA